ncbi:MAG: undecaprenyl-diphosphate phosphatase [Candidatus Nanoarchaeia archaeon]|nr:undecaprenyl-diphosphate phosphatase [Candidatus Nanoarchaeia archaeon]
MNIIIALISGMLQGILEWIPIGSQNIIANFLVLTGYTSLQANDIALFLHIGTMFAVISYFKKDLHNIIKPKTSYDLSMLYFMISSLFTSLLIGGPIYFFLKSDSSIFLSINIFIGLMLIVTGALQVIRNNFNLRKIDSNVTANDGLISGIAQGFSVIPNVSRSGITIFSLLMMGFKPDYAVKLSFLISIPVIFIEAFYQAFFKGFVFDIGYLIAAITAFFIGRLVIGHFFKFIKKINFSAFCILLGILSIISAIF